MEQKVNNKEEQAPLEEVPAEKKKLKASDVGIFVFLGIMGALMVGVIAFVIYVCTGSAAGCNCPQCAGKVGLILNDLINGSLR